MRRVIALSALILVAFAASVRADELVLKTGRKLAGRILKEDDAQVTIQLRGGNMVIARGQIESIRKCPPPADLDAPSPAPEKKSDAKDGGRAGGDPDRKPAEAGPTPVSPAATDRLAKARDLLAELGEIRLVTWPDEETKVASEPDRKAYKLVRADGSATMRDERPTSPDAIAALYVLVDSSDGEHVFFVNGAKQVLWRRLHWHADGKKWLVVSPELEAFQRDRALADRICDECCVDQNGRIGACGAEYSMKESRNLRKPPPIEKQRAQLLESCVLAMGSPEGGELLARVHEANIAIDCAKYRLDKIRLAGERRVLLGKLLGAALPKK